MSIISKNKTRCGFEIDQTAGVTRYIHYVSSPAGLVSMIVKEGANAPNYYFTYTDHLGSILRVTSRTGTIIADQNFDAWGRKRNPLSWDYLGAPSVPVWLYRGYTGHEHLPQFGLINMNGRLYDPVLGRMLSTDNFIHEDAGLNGFNRYAYAFNNPLKYTDPDGEIPALVAIGVGALVGVLSNGIQNEINDRPFFENAGSAALMGGISGAISCGIGAIAADNFFLQMMLHGISSGVMSEVSGGSFASGFFSGALSSGVASSLQGAGAVAQILGGGVSGGFGSVMGGGSFLDGVRQGIITSGLNHVLHQGVAGIMSGGGGNEPGKAYQDGADRHLQEKKLATTITGATSGLAKAIKPAEHLQRTQYKFFSIKTPSARFLASSLRFVAKGSIFAGAVVTAYNLFYGYETNYYRAFCDVGACVASYFPPLGTAGAAIYWGTRSYIFPESGTGNGGFIQDGTKLPRFGNGGTLELEISPRGTRIIK